MSCSNQPDSAPFYAVRAEVMEDSNTAQAEADFEKALSINKDWRYYKLLADYYLSKQEYTKALATIEPYAKAHPDNYITGLLYAKTLLFTNKLKEADQLISHLNILPFEGATDSHDLYREAKLKEAIEALHNRNYKEGLTYIKEAKLYPPNLGRGKTV